MPWPLRVLRVLWRLIKGAAARFIADDCTALAAAIAYYAVFSLPGVLVVIVRLVGFWLGDLRVQERIMSLLATRIGEQAADLLAELVGRGAGEMWKFNVAAVIAASTLVFSATTAFAQVQAALNRVWRVEADEQSSAVMGFLIRRAVSFVMILGGGLLLVLSMTARAALSAVQQFVGGGVLSSTGVLVAEVVVSLAVTALLFAGIYRAVPDATVLWRDALAGGAFTAVLFTLGNRAVGVYFHYVPVGGVYGPAGSLALLLFWFYFVAALLLFGAQFTQGYARFRGRMIGRREGSPPPPWSA